MGRTKRRRKKIREKEKHDWSEIIQLQKSMKLKCKHLKIGYFSGTGRGIKCTKKITKGGILIALPLCHLITTDSPSNIFSFLKSKLSNPQLVLSVLLIYENHLQRESKYVEYLRTLPKSYTNLYFCTMEEIQLLPDFIQNLVLRQRDNLQHLYKKLSDSINNAICPHCNVPISNFYTEDKFLWAWFTVHTRSVYYEVSFGYLAIMIRI